MSTTAIVIKKSTRLRGDHPPLKAQLAMEA
jgi:hypothetical protein